MFSKPLITSFIKINPIFWRHNLAVRVGVLRNKEYEAQQCNDYEVFNVKNAQRSYSSIYPSYGRSELFNNQGVLGWIPTKNCYYQWQGCDNWVILNLGGLTRVKGLAMPS